MRAPGTLFQSTTPAATAPWQPSPTHKLPESPESVVLVGHRASGIEFVPPGVDTVGIIEEREIDGGPRFRDQVRQDVTEVGRLSRPEVEDESLETRRVPIGIED